MPTWLSTILIAILNIAGKPAIVAVLTWIEGQFPGLSTVIEYLLSQINGLPPEEQAKRLKAMHEALVKHCEGTACAPELKS